MEATEDVIILKVNTQEAVQSVGDLKNNIKVLKKDLESLDIGSTEYADTLNELKLNQNALKDAMYATSSSMQDVAQAASGASESYNSLVHRMAALKEEWRATNNEARRNEVGQQIADINDKLKEMDASVGNFQRNVGNYESGVAGLVEKFDQWGETLKMMPPTLGAAKEQIGKVGETMQLVGKQPILGIIGLLAPIIMKITSALQENETAMGAVNRVMEAMQPIFNVVNNILEKIAQGFSNLIDKIINLAGNGGWFGKVITSITGVGNALLQYLLVPIKTTIEAFKGLGNIMKDVFTGQWKQVKEDAKNAWEGIKNVFSEGFSFKQNFLTGKEWGKQLVEGVKENKPEAQAAGEEIAEEVTKPIKREKRRIEEIKVAQVTAEQKLTDSIKEEMQKRMEASQEEHNQALANAEQRKTATIEGLNAAASATSSILSGIADLYEQDGVKSKKEARKIKALRIASATIDMIQGAVTAFASAQQLGPIAGPIVGGINAAAVTAMGMMNIAKIKATNIDSPSEGGSTASAPASVSAPNIDTNLPSVRNVTSASEEDRLNRMASSQKVYILQSDIEAAGHQSKVQVAESSF